MDINPQKHTKANKSRQTEFPENVKKRIKKKFETPNFPKIGKTEFSKKLETLSFSKIRKTEFPKNGKKRIKKNGNKEF